MPDAPAAVAAAANATADLLEAAGTSASKVLRVHVRWQRDLDAHQNSAARSRPRGEPPAHGIANRL